jgi:hypothetical protein
VPRWTGSRKYDPLTAYLAALDDDAATLTLTLPEVEAIIGARLPATATSSQF